MTSYDVRKLVRFILYYESIMHTLHQALNISNTSKEQPNNPDKLSGFPPRRPENATTCPAVGGRQRLVVHAFVLTVNDRSAFRGIFGPACKGAKNNALGGVS